VGLGVVIELAHQVTDTGAQGVDLAVGSPQLVFGVERPLVPGRFLLAAGVLGLPGLSWSTSGMRMASS
jgi:hypothetical protein